MWPGLWPRRARSFGCWSAPPAICGIFEDLKAERVTGDLRDAASLKKAVAGCDVVFHVAADYRLWVRDPREMYRSNVEGTRAILEAARESRVRRVVYTSSVATMGFHIERAPWPTKNRRFPWTT